MRCKRWTAFGAFQFSRAAWNVVTLQNLWLSWQNCGMQNYIGSSCRYFPASSKVLKVVLSCVLNCTLETWDSCVHLYDCSIIRCSSWLQKLAQHLRTWRTGRLLFCSVIRSGFIRFHQSVLLWIWLLPMPKASNPRQEGHTRGICHHGTRCAKAGGQVTWPQHTSKRPFWDKPANMLLLIKASMSVHPTSSHLANVHFWSVSTLTCYCLSIELSCEPSPLMIRQFDGTTFRNAGIFWCNGIGCGQRMGDEPCVVFATDTGGFFGVFGGRCSGFIANRIEKELEQSGMPEDDAAVTDLALRLDKEFLISYQPGDFTGTFVIVKAPSTPGGSLAVFSKAWLHASETDPDPNETQQTSFLSSFQLNRGYFEICGSIS